MLTIMQNHIAIKLHSTHYIKHLKIKQGIKFSMYQNDGPCI